MKKVIGVCGSDEDDKNLTKYASKIAENVGKLVAKNRGVIICGGRGGIMRAVCKGAKEEEGLTIGVLPYLKEEANEFVDIGIPTQLGQLRNFIVVNAADAIIAIGGRWGTLNEISFAMILKKPLILIKETGGCVDDIISGKLLQNIYSQYIVVDSAETAVEKAFKIIDNDSYRKKRQANCE